jgi:hypothetical protein
VEHTEWPTYDQAGQAVEILYDEDDSTALVYHAMKCRPPLIKKYLGG